MATASALFQSLPHHSTGVRRVKWKGKALANRLEGFLIWTAGPVHLPRWYSPCLMSVITPLMCLTLKGVNSPKAGMRCWGGAAQCKHVVTGLFMGYASCHYLAQSLRQSRRREKHGHKLCQRHAIWQLYVPNISVMTSWSTTLDLNMDPMKV